MPNLYASGELLQELDGTIQGGVTVLMHNPQELENVTFLCGLTSKSNVPIHALYGLLNTKEMFASVPFSESARRAWTEAETLDFDHPGQALMAACSFVEDLWKQAAKAADFTCTLTIARPERDMRLDIDVSQPGLVFHSGSLLATLVSGPLTVFGWSLALFSSRGIGGSTRANRIVEDFRAKALSRGGAQPLERLDNLPANYLTGKKAVIVLLHGLLSIDAGLFDPLLQQMRSDPAFEACAVVGWPHNTLAGIRENAVELLPVFGRGVGIDGPDIGFICHSRGGLLARAIAVELARANANWTQKLKACVTFGTPHTGSPLAEAPGDLLGKLVAIQAVRNGDGFLSLLDALHIVHQQPSIQGVLDLRPIGGGGDFLRDLVRDEANSAPSGAERALPMLAVGGKAEDRGFFAELSRRALAGTENDLIVETSSSSTRYSEKNLVTRCNHFEYFRAPQAQTDTFAEAISFLKERLALDGKVAKAESESLAETKNDVVIGHALRYKKKQNNYTAAKPSSYS